MLLGKKSWVFIALLAIGAGAFFTLRGRAPHATAAAKPVAEKPILPPDDGVHSQYAGSKTCAECHAAEYEAWLNSNHGLAEREYRKDMDEPGFVPRQTFQHGKDNSGMFLDAKGVATFLTRGLGNQRREYPVVRVIGNNPLRQFLVPAPGNRLQTMDISWDPHRKEWFDVYGEDEREPGDWGAWTGQGMNWNAMCAACHNTRLRKHYDPQTNSYKTTMAEMSVGCEACHGPMKDHVQWHKNPPPGVSKETKDPTIKRQTRDRMLDTCGACHARRGEITGDMVPGEPFHDHFSLTVTDGTDIYHPDGQVRDENYEYASFLSSRMHHAGVRCTDCHEPHTGKRLIQGNMLCMRCHAGGTQPPATVIDPLTHGHHAEGSAGNDCTSCHMPVTTYMQRHPRHDHGFTIPDPLLTKEFGVPNACNRCHTDKDADWALRHTDEWYGEKMNRPTRTRAILVAKARRGAPEAPAGLIALLKTEPIAAWRATACHLLERWSLTAEVSAALVSQLKDASPLVREAAVRSLINSCRNDNPSVRAAITPLLEDETRTVRVAAAWALVDALDLSSRAGKELVHMLDLNSDQPTGRMQLSQFAFERGDSATAIRQIRKAIEWDANSPPFHHDLAILLSTTGDNPAAIKALREAIRLAPDEAEYQYKLALALNETGNLPAAVTALEKTVTLDPGHGRAWYNLGLAYNSQNQTQQAIAALAQGEQADPSDPAIPYARATIHARLGQREQALQAAAQALQLRPDFPEAMQLMRSLAR
jgi:tetratricopeptide (TPR) repeat protein